MGFLRSGFLKGEFYMKTAILVDGGYYRKRSQHVFGKVTSKERADELYRYCNRRLKETHFEFEKYADLYRIFYYDCPPIDKQVNHPLTQKSIDFTKSETKQWTEDFFNEISKKRKVALRLGELNEATVHYNLKHSITKKILKGIKNCLI